MQAIAFIGEAEDGSIKIPKEYRSALKKNFQVIILLEDENIKEQKEVKKRKLTALKLKTKGFKFDRESYA